MKLSAMRSGPAASGATLLLALLWSVDAAGQTDSPAATAPAAPPSQQPTSSAASVAAEETADPAAPETAEPEPTPSAAQPAPAPATQPQVTPTGPVWIDVRLEGFELEPQLIRIAVAKELSLSVSDSADASPTHVGVHAAAGGDIIVTYRTGDGPELMRAVSAPARADEVPEISALLVGNLARDESGPLLAQLEARKQTQEQADATPPTVTAPKDQTPPEEKKRKRDEVVNFSVFPPLSTVPDPQDETINVDISLFFSRIGGLHGFGVTPGIISIGGVDEGAHVSGIGHYTEGDGWGGRYAGLFGIGLGDYRGMSAAGLFDYGAGRFDGLQAAGTASIQMGSVRGAQLGGAVSVAKQAEGAQIAGAASVAKHIEGAQISGAANVAQEITGAQIAVVNIGGKVEGAQVGLVNVADELDGASIGLITVAGSGKVQPVTWYSSTQPLNFGVRLYTGPLYAMPTIGYDPSDESKDAKVGFIFGGRIPIQRAFVDVDAGYSNATDFKSYDEHAIELRYRVLGGYSVTDWLGIFAGGGALHSFHTQGPTDESFDPELVAGVEFF
jgi:hypothetical protein